MRRIEPPTLVVSDALELARVERVSLSPAQEILVLPRTERVKWVPGAGEKWRRATGAAPLEPFGATEVDGLRPYRQGTPASRIHWAAFARGAGLLERRLRADTETRPLVVVDARVDESAHSSEHLDAAVRAAASLVLELGTRTGCGLLLPGEYRPLEVESDLIAWPVARARLALVEGGPGTRAPGLAPGARSAQVLYVAAAAHARLPPGLAGAGVRAAILVVPKGLANQPRQRASFEVAGCVGFVVGAGRRVQGARSVSTNTQVAVLAPLRKDQGPRPRAIAKGHDRPLIRLLSFGALGLYGVVRWGTLMNPAPTGRLLGLLAVALLLAGLGPVLVERERAGAALRGATEPLTALGAPIALIAILAVFPISGVPLSWTIHLRVADTANGIGQGLSALPGIFVPYAGINQWVRVTMLLGAAVLLLDAALPPGVRAGPRSGICAARAPLCR